MKSYNVNYIYITTWDMEIDVFSRVVMLNYIGMSLWLLFIGFNFKSITWYPKYKGDSAEIFKKYLLEERPINSFK
jgi:hypothetical protein